MAVSVAAVMRHVNNYFSQTRIDSTFSISGGTLTPAPTCRYVYIEGSALHDGVYQITGGKLVGAEETADETFNGSVFTLNPPRDFLELCDEIAEFDTKCPMGSLQSESFGDYSYTRGNDSGAGSGGWAGVFKARLNQYRTRMFGGVM